MSKFEALKITARDALDIARRSDSMFEAIKPLLPASMRKLRVLNEGDPSELVKSPAALAQALRGLMHQLEGEAILAGAVDYRRLRESGAFAELERTAPVLRVIDPADFDNENQAKAFWVNLYNVLCIHGTVALGIRQSVMEKPAFFGTVAYRVGEHAFTPDDIENGVLRANGKHPAGGRPQFKQGDPRLGAALSAVDPRIHTALVCTAKSCPPISHYSEELLDKQLDLASENYVAGQVRVDEREKAIYLPITFHHYAVDFGGMGGVWDFILRHAGGEHHKRCKKAIEEKWAVKYDRYDWTLNEA